MITLHLLSASLPRLKWVESWSKMSS
jgi:hypothetical protein